MPRHRAYAMRLLASITPSQRWGIGEVAPKGWKLYFKGGWGYGTGLMDHERADPQWPAGSAPCCPTSY